MFYVEFLMFSQSAAWSRFCCIAVIQSQKPGSYGRCPFREVCVCVSIMAEHQIGVSLPDLFFEDSNKSLGVFLPLGGFQNLQENCWNCFTFRNFFSQTSEAETLAALWGWWAVKEAQEKPVRKAVCGRCHQKFTGISTSLRAPERREGKGAAERGLLLRPIMEQRAHSMMGGFF